MKAQRACRLYETVYNKTLHKDVVNEEPITVTVHQTIEERDEEERAHDLMLIWRAAQPGFSESHGLAA